MGHEIPACVIYMTYHPATDIDICEFAAAVVKHLFSDSDEQDIKDMVIGHLATSGKDISKIQAMELSGISAVSCNHVKRKYAMRALCQLCPYSSSYCNQNLKQERQYLSYMMQDASAWQDIMGRFTPSQLKKCVKSVMAGYPDYNNKEVIKFYDTFNKLLINSLCPLSYEANGVKNHAGVYVKRITDACAESFTDTLAESLGEDYRPAIEREIQFLLSCPHTAPNEYKEMLQFLGSCMEQKEEKQVEKQGSREDSGNFNHRSITVQLRFNHRKKHL